MWPIATKSMGLRRIAEDGRKGIGKLVDLVTVKGHVGQ